MSNQPQTPIAPPARSVSRVLSLSLQNHESHVQVVCRLRPLSEGEIQKSGSESPVELVDEQTLCINHKEALNVFTFDRVFGPDATQDQIYDLAATETVEETLKGYNGTIFAYGQTGAGKSYTMFGGPNSPGIIPRISHHIFSHIDNSSSDTEYTVEVSCMEIYMEQIRDLLNPTATEFSIHEDKDNGVYVKGLSHAYVTNETEFEEIVSLGNKHRSISATHMNTDLSRSHVIVRISITQKLEQEIVRSNLFLIDLAGSEKIDRTGAKGQNLEEAKKINLSLSSLGQVINSLTDPTATHIPYRDSKLTRILQESLGGNSRTTLIINISPAVASAAETISTLRFGARAKKIKNTAHVNSEPSIEMLKARVKMLEEINKTLEDQLSARKTNPLSSPNVNLLTPRGATTISMVPERSNYSADDIQRKNKKIEELEKQLLDMKMNQVKQQHEEDLKLFKLETVLHRLNDKLSDVELINENLRKHLLISEKIIESRDVKIDKLRQLLGEQQIYVQLESQHFDNKLRKLKEKLDSQEISDERTPNQRASTVLEDLYSAAQADGEAHQSDTNSELRNPEGQSPQTPKYGLNLRIVKPVRGGGYLASQ